MKQTLVTLSLILGFISNSMASTRGDVKIIEASENIRYISQEIAKEYLYLYYNPHKINFKIEIIENMKKLKKNIQEIEINSQNSESKNILNFLTYTNEEIQTLLNREISKDKSILILDYSETFVEAANSIESLHKYQFSKEEKMLMALKELEYLLERINKYYIASILNLNKISNQKHLKSALEKTEILLKSIKKYPYPKTILKERENIMNYWENNKKILMLSNRVSLPNLILTLHKNFEKDIRALELFHKQKQ